MSGDEAGSFHEETLSLIEAERSIDEKVICFLQTARTEANIDSFLGNSGTFREYRL